MLVANHVRGSFNVTATAGGMSTTFSLTNTAIPAALTIMQGNKQQAAVTEGLKTPLQVKVTDAVGKPISGINVEFAVEPNGDASATFSSPPSVLTNANGIATAPALTANTSAGTFTVEAWATGLGAPAIFTLSNVPGPAANISPVVQTLSATVGKSYLLQALVSDADGNSVKGVKVTFSVPAAASHNPGGSFQGKTTFTAVSGSNGVASA